MKTIIKIVITLVVITCCFQAARYALNNFQFEDAVQQRLLFDTRASDTEVVGHRADGSPASTRSCSRKTMFRSR